MEQSGSYQIKKIASDVGTEINRLKAQVELFWKQELKLYKEYGLQDAMAIVELGSGPGFVTIKLLEQFPQSHITAVEIDPFLVDYARNSLAENNVTQCQVMQGSIMGTGLAENLFDFAIIRLVLEHLPDPVNAVQEVRRILKPGGKAIFVDNDFEMHIMTYPNVPELRALYDAYCQSRFAEGGNPKIGRELPGILKQGGFAKVDFEIMAAHSDLLGEAIFFESEGIGIPMQLVHDGYLSSKLMGKLAVNWRQMLRNEKHSILRQLYVAVGEK